MLTVGEILQGRYRILREIGSGGMGTVYEGENLRIRRRVAIKVMRATDEPSAELIARFEREAQVASQIPSDHITEVLDMGELDNGHHFIVMEFLAGESLASRMDRTGRFDPKELVILVRQVLAALSAAHAAGVIHRDIKPDNVFILGEKAGQNDFVKLLDFGVSKVRRAGEMQQLTQTGAVVGTPSYMAPEQVGGAEASPLWDLYAVGVLLYRGLTGDVPYKSLQLNDLVYKISLGRFTPPRERVPEIDPVLDAIVCKAMSRSSERFQSAEEFIAALDRWLGRSAGRSPSSSPQRQTFDGVGSVTPGSPVEPEAPTQQVSQRTTLTTEVLSQTNKRRRQKLLPWVAVPVALGSVGLALVFAGDGEHENGARQGTGVYASQPGSARDGVDQLPPASATPATANGPGATRAPAASAAQSEVPKAAPSVRAEAPAAPVRPMPAPSAAASASSSDDSKAKKRDRRANEASKKKRDDAAEPRPAKTEPAPKSESDERPDWGY
ncbi:MAG: serine/threonine-protein kinase [Polyangiaceae bacterium]